MWAPVDVREFLGGLQAFPILPDTSIEQVEDALRAAEETDKDSGGWFWLLPDTEQAKLCIYLLELINEFDGFLANVTGTGRLPDGYNSAIRTLCILVAVLIWIIEHQPRNQG
ncbi:MAG: hypothetical protein JWQ48_1193 [Conexibacter sp.]|nr:hypothetical protein [Conexibacter sp.]